MQPNTAQMPPRSALVAPRKPQLCTLESLDGRTVAARRANELAAAFERDLGDVLTAAQRHAVRRAAMLSAISEDLQARRLAGEDIAIDDIVRAHGAATRAERSLGIKPASPPEAESPLREYLASLPADEDAP